MTSNSTPAASPVLIVPYVWIGDFVRCHSVVKLLRSDTPERPVDMVSSTLCAPLADYMPGIRQVIVIDLPRRRLGVTLQQQLARTLREENYGQALVMSRKWKAALAPFLAGIPLRTGFAGEFRFGLLNDVRWGERKLKVPADEVARWRARRGLESDTRPIVALSPGAVGEGKAWPVGHYAALARALVNDGATVWVLGGPNETPLAKEIAAAGGANVRDLTGPDLRNAILAMAAADVAVTNDSGLMHVSAAIGTPTVAIFGPTSPWHWKPLNPIAAIIEPPGDEAAVKRARTEGNDAVRHRSTADVAVEIVLASVREVLRKGR